LFSCAETKKGDLLMQSPYPVNQQPDAEQFPPEVYPLAAAYQMGVPLDEHVYPTYATSCLISGVVGLLCIGGLVAGVSGLTYFVVSLHLLPTPFVKSTVFEWLVAALIGLAVLLEESSFPPISCGTACSEGRRRRGVIAFAGPNWSMPVRMACCGWTEAK